MPAFDLALRVMSVAQWQLRCEVVCTASDDPGGAASTLSLPPDTAEHFRPGDQIVVTVTKEPRS